MLSSEVIRNEWLLEQRRIYHKNRQATLSLGEISARVKHHFGWKRRRRKWRRNSQHSVVWWTWPIVWRTLDI